MTIQQWIVGIAFLVVGVFLIGFDVFNSRSKKAVKAEIDSAKAKVEEAVGAANDVASVLSDTTILQLADPHNLGIRAFRFNGNAQGETVAVDGLMSAKEDAEKSKTAGEEAIEKLNSAAGSVYSTLATSHPLAILGVVLMIAGAGAMGVQINLTVG